MVTMVQTGPYGCVTMFGTLNNVKSQMTAGDTILVNITLDITPGGGINIPSNVSTECNRILPNSLQNLDRLAGRFGSCSAVECSTQPG